MTLAERTTYRVRGDGELTGPIALSGRIYPERPEPKVITQTRLDWANSGVVFWGPSLGYKKSTDNSAGEILYSPTGTRTKLSDNQELLIALLFEKPGEYVSFEKFASAWEEYSGGKYNEGRIERTLIEIIEIAPLESKRLEYHPDKGIRLAGAFENKYHG
jgi:hypothetical protein